MNEPTGGLSIDVGDGRKFQLSDRFTRSIGKNIYDLPDPPDITPEDLEGVEAMDFGKMLMRGFSNVGSGLGWLAKKTGLDPNAVVENSYNDAVDWWNDSLSEPAKRELAKRFVTRDEDGSLTWGDAGLTSAALQGVGLAPDVLASLTGGAGAVKALKMFANPLGRKALVETLEQGSKAGATVQQINAAKQAQKKLQMVDSAIGIGGFGGFEGTYAGAQNASEVEQMIFGRSHEDLLESERYRDIFNATDDSASMDERIQYAKETLMQEAGNEAFWKSGMATAALGAPAGAFFGKLLSARSLSKIKADRIPAFGPVNETITAAARSRPGAMAKGALIEGVTEGVQEATETAITLDVFNRVAAGDEDILAESMNAGVLGALAGAGAGGVFSAAGYKAPSIKDSDPDINSLAFKERRTEISEKLKARLDGADIQTLEQTAQQFDQIRERENGGATRLETIAMYDVLAETGEVPRETRGIDEELNDPNPDLLAQKIQELAGEMTPEQMTHVRTIDPITSVRNLQTLKDQPPAEEYVAFRADSQGFVERNLGPEAANMLAGHIGRALSDINVDVYHAGGGNFVIPVKSVREQRRLKKALDEIEPMTLTNGENDVEIRPVVATTRSQAVEGATPWQGALQQLEEAEAAAPPDPAVEAGTGQQIPGVDEAPPASVVVRKPGEDVETKRTPAVRVGANANEDQVAERIEEAAALSATSPENALQPTQAELESGNYQKGRVQFQHGLTISIENPVGSKRRGRDKDTGEEWSRTLKNHYGYIEGTKGNDGDEIDAFLGPAPNNPLRPVFVVNQISPDGKFDEHKVMLGFRTREAAVEAYRQNYPEENPTEGDVAQMGFQEFKRWLKDGDKSAPIGTRAKEAEVQDAEAVREDAGQVPEGGAVQEGSTKEGGPDLQRGKEAGREAGRLEGAPAPTEEIDVVPKGRYRFAAGDVADSGIRFKNLTQISWEAAPGASTGILSGYANATPEQRAEFHEAIDAVFRGPNGENRLAQEMGLPWLKRVRGPGVWKGESDPSSQEVVATPIATGQQQGRVRDIDPAAVNALDGYAAIVGRTLKQEGVGWVRPDYASTKARANGVQVDIGRSFTAEEAVALERAVNARVADGTDVVFTATEEGMFVFQLPAFGDAGPVVDENGDIQYNMPNYERAKAKPDFHKAVKAAVLEDLDIEAGFTQFRAASNLIENDWTEDSNGEGYLRQARRSGYGSVAEWADRVLAPEIEAVYEEFAGRYGWGETGTVVEQGGDFRFSIAETGTSGNRPRGPLDELARGGRPEGDQGTPRAKPGEEELTGLNFTQSPRPVLDGRYYGTGYRGDEWARVSSASDTRIKHRVYMYVDNGSGIRPEKGVGDYAKIVTMPNMYDYQADPLGLIIEHNGDINAIESAILDNGYSGYFVRESFDGQATAVTLGDASHAIQTRAVDEIVQTPTVSRDLPSSPARELAGRLRDIEKDLPMGSPPGSRWIERITELDPDLKSDLESFGVFESMDPEGNYYLSDIIKKARRLEAEQNRSILREMQDEIPDQMTEPEIGANLRARWSSDFDGAVSEYESNPESYDGQILNTDVARELSPEYRDDRSRSSDVHEAASDFIKALYAKRLSEPTPEGFDRKVVFSAGGTGAGKTTGLKQVLDNEGDPEIIYDTNSNNVPSTKKKIDAALEAGRNVEIVYTHRDPIESFVNGVIPRAMRMKREQGTGRTVPTYIHAETHAQANDAIRELAQIYENDNRVIIRVVDNSKGKGKATEIALTDLPTVPTEEEINEQLLEEVQSALEEGRIGRAEAAGFRTRPFEPGPAGRPDRQGGGPEPEQARPQRDPDQLNQIADYYRNSVAAITTLQEEKNFPKADREAMDAAQNEADLLAAGWSHAKTKDGEIVLLPIAEQQAQGYGSKPTQIREWLDGTEFSGMDIKVHADHRSAPISLQRAMGFDATGANNQSLPVEAAYDTKTGEVHVFSNMVISETELHRILTEEIVGHAGLRAVFGEKFDQFLDTAEIPTARLMPIARTYRLNLNNAADLRVAREEYVAKLTPASGTIWNQFMDWLRQALRDLGIKLELTDAEGQRLLHRAREAVLKGTAPTARFSAEVRFSFGGANAETSDMGSLEDAMIALDNGANPETVRQETGWFKGLDGRWRFEINDQKARLRIPQDPEWEAALGDILTHPALFAAYPILKRVTVRGEPMREGEGGSYDHLKGVITINSNRKVSESLSTIMHESQHAIQDIEGFASGGSLRTGVSGLVAQSRGKLREIRREIDQFDPDVKKVARTYGRYIQQKLVDFGSAADAKEAVVRRAYKEFEDALQDGGFNKGDPEVQRVIALIEEQEAIHGWIDAAVSRGMEPKIAFEAYRRLAGEVEARNVQSRLTFNEDRRKRTSPQETSDIPADEVIVMRNGEVVSNAPMPANAMVGATNPDIRFSTRPREQSKQLDDGFIRWIETDDTAYVIDIQSGPNTRGKDLLGWLEQESGKELYAVGVVEEARGFWDKMEDNGLVAGQTDENFMDFFGFRFSVADQWRFSAATIAPSGNTRVNDILDRVLAKSDYDKSPGERLFDLKGRATRLFDNWQLKAKQGLIDSGASLEALEKELNGALGEGANSAWKAYHLTHNLNNVMSAVIKYGVPIRDAQGWFTIDPNGKGLSEIFSPLVKNGSNLMRLWEGYAAARRGRQLLDEKNPDGSPRERLMAEDEIQTLLALGEEFPVLEQVFDEYQAFNRKLLDLATDVGLLNEETRDMWAENDYVPFYRVFEEDVEGPAGMNTGGSRAEVRSTGIRRLTGSERQLQPILENIVMNTANLIDKTYKHEAMKRIRDLGVEAGAMEQLPQAWKPVKMTNGMIADTLRKAGMLTGRVAQVMDETGLEAKEAYDAMVADMTGQERDRFQTMFEMTVPQGNDVVGVMENGRVRYYRVSDPMLLRTIKGMGAENFGHFVRMMRGFRSTLTSMVTLDPGFMMANWMRDTLSAWVTSSDVEFTPLTDAVKSFGDIWTGKRDSTYAKVLMAGGSGGGFYDVHPGDLTRTMEDQMGTTVLNSPSKILNAYRRIGNVSEQSNRIAIGAAVLKGGGSVAEAAFQAQDVTNFTSHGDWVAMRLLTQTVPFMNARIQGLYKLYRGGRDNPTKFMLRGMGVVAATALLLAKNWDDERYESLPDWQKDIYWHIFVGDQHFAIPKPFEAGVIFGAMPERLLRLAGGRDELQDTGRFLTTTIGETLAMNPIPQAFKPLIEQWANKSFFMGRDIMPFYQTGLQPEAQYRHYTSDTARLVGDLMPDFAPEFLRSPARLEHLVRGYLGTMGHYMMTAADGVANKVAGYAPRPETSILDFPAVKRFARGSGPQPTRYESMLWDSLKEVDAAYSTMNAYMRQGRQDAARELREEKADLLANRDALQEVANTIRDLNDVEKQIMFSLMDPAEKRRRLDDIQQRKNQLLKRTVPDLYLKVR